MLPEDPPGSSEDPPHHPLGPEEHKTLQQLQTYSNSPQIHSIYAQWWPIKAVSLSPPSGYTYIWMRYISNDLHTGLWNYKRTNTLMCSGIISSQWIIHHYATGPWESCAVCTAPTRWYLWHHTEDLYSIQFILSIRHLLFGTYFAHIRNYHKHQGTLGVILCYITICRMLCWKSNLNRDCICYKLLTGTY